MMFINNELKRHDDYHFQEDFLDEFNITEVIRKVKIPFKNFLKSNKKKDIYSGCEKMAFSKRHPVYQNLMKLEFEKI